MKENSIEEDIKLAEEEKKAIESFKQENENDLSRFEDFNNYTQTLIKRNKTILNLIQKQKKEISELKKENELKDKAIKLMAEYIESKNLLIDKNFHVLTAESIKEEKKAINMLNTLR